MGGKVVLYIMHFEVLKTTGPHPQVTYGLVYIYVTSSQCLTSCGGTITRLYMYRENLEIVQP